MKFLYVFIFCVSSALAWSQQPDVSNLNALVANVNSRHDEQNPIVSPDGRHLYFTRANDSMNIAGPRDKGDIWVAEMQANGRWSKPANLGRPVNDELKNTMLGFSPDGHIMFLNHEKVLPGGIIVNDGITFSAYRNGRWTKPEKIAVDYLINKSSHQSGSISSDGKWMVLSLQAYASRGAEDIYISSYRNGRWTQPQNLGSAINTAGQEMTPYLSPDLQELYFSSNGHGGFGGRDLFVAQRQGAGFREWSKPKNLGKKVNSFGVELNYCMDTKNKLAYFSSTQNSDGYGDIRAISIEVSNQEVQPAEEQFEELAAVIEEKSKSIFISGKVLEAETRQPLTAAINIHFDNEAIDISTDKENGSFQLEVPADTRQLALRVKSPGYMGVSESVALHQANWDTTFVLTPLEVGTTIRLNKVYFNRGTSDLLQDSFDELDRVVEMMNENPDVKIELSGHTDNQGSSKLNLKLSQERVDKVKQYLSEHGISAKRIKGKGYGGTKPVASNASEATRKLNRRVEITILKN